MILDYISCENKLKNKGALIPRSLQPTRRYDKKDENSVTNYCAIFRCKKYQKFFFSFRFVCQKEPKVMSFLPKNASSSSSTKP